MKAMLVTLFALLALVHAQTPSAYSTWTANFICTAPQFGTGVFEGKMLYDWTINAFKITFAGDEGYEEFYQFNPERGYNQGVATGQFAFQYLYKRSKSCPCETTGLNFAMPALFSDALKGATAITTNLPYWSAGGADSSLKDIDGKAISAVKYLANSGFTNIINSIPKAYILTSSFWTTSDYKPVAFNINDFQRRTFILTNVVEATPGSLDLVAPKTGCKCGKQLDVVLSLDRSGSINSDQWTLELQFTKNLMNAFEYGPLATNMGIGNWNAAQWRTLELTSGINTANVQSAVNSMTCCPKTSPPSCCCCGTPIGGGLWLGGDMLSKSIRGKSQKILILLTDGCQNHLWYPATQKAVSCGCANEKICAQNKTCVGDITKWYNWVVENIPGVRIIVVGVGGADTICTEQLLLAAGGDSLNVYNPSSWTQLLSLVESISATACTADNALCPGCCGICTCGQCIPPTKCIDKDKCNTGVLDSTGCCTSQKVECPKKLCQFEYCDTNSGCGWANISCTKDTECIKYSCNNSYVCDASKKTDANGNDLPQCTTVVVHQCENASQCNDNNTCTTDDCINFRCVNNVIKCPDNDACSYWVCKPQEGCSVIKKNCDDKNNCTTDTCDPKTGCSNVNITCAQPKDSCKRVICDRTYGCQQVPRDCTKEGWVAGNCTVPACNETCYNQSTCTALPPTSSEGIPDTVVLVSALTTAAVAGIIIAAVILVAGIGGGAAVAIVQVGAGGGSVVTASNPLYAASGTSGTNPLNQG